MTQEKDKIFRLIRQGESEKVEFKEAFGKEAIETICAFANTRGGTLLIGIDDHGRAKGIQLGKSTLKELQNQISQGTGGLAPSIEIVRMGGKSIIKIYVEESRIKPVMHHGKAFKRSGNTTRQMHVGDLSGAVLNTVGVTWDVIIETRASLSDIDSSKVKEFIQSSNKTGRRRIPVSTSIELVLGKLGLLQGKHPTRAAVLLFGKKPQRFYSSAFVKVGRFRDETLILDDREIGGTLFDQVEGTMDYFREKLDTRFEMTGRPQRDVIWEYPLDALREAVINAVCHRDYMSGGHTQVRLYDNYVYVWNSGGLPDGLTLDMLKKEHRSVPRNQLIAEVFYYAGAIEKWGSGIGKIIGECKAQGLPEPVFEELQGFRVTFKKAAPRTPLRHLPSTPHDTPHEPPMMSTEERILAFCKIPRSREEIVSKLGLSSDYVRKDILPNLIRAGRLSYTLPNKPQSRKQRYVTTKKGHTLKKKRT